MVAFLRFALGVTIVYFLGVITAVQYGPEHTAHYSEFLTYLESNLGEYGQEVVLGFAAFVAGFALWRPTKRTHTRVTVQKGSGGS